jgi:hypothetical protein
MYNLEFPSASLFFHRATNPYAFKFILISKISMLLFNWLLLALCKSFKGVLNVLICVIPGAEDVGTGLGIQHN